MTFSFCSYCSQNIRVDLRILSKRCKDIVKKINHVKCCKNIASLCLVQACFDLPILCMAIVY
jgi:predicted nucleic acid-binding Zn ribbon protein